MVKFTVTSSERPQGFGFDSRNNRERRFLPEFFIRRAWTDRTGVRGDTLLAFSEGERAASNQRGAAKI
jgi:hypothetical protein